MVECLPLKQNVLGSKPSWFKKLIQEIDMPYVVKFKDGYYAKNQPNFEWSFTNDIEKANVYTRASAAQALVERGISVIGGEYKTGVVKEIQVIIAEGAIIPFEPKRVLAKAMAKDNSLYQPCEK